MLRRFAILLSLFLFVVNLYSRDNINYYDEAEIIKEKLYQSLKLYKDGDAASARELASEAYFSHFENMEGPIGRNIGRKGYLMERKFTNLRSYYGSKASISKIEALIDGLVFDIDEVTPIIQNGFRLKAEATQVGYDEKAVADKALEEEKKRREEALAAFGLSEDDAKEVSNSQSSNIMMKNDIEQDRLSAQQSLQEAASLHPKLQYLYDQISDNIDEVIKLSREGKYEMSADLLRDTREKFYIRSDLEVAINSVKNINMRSKFRLLGNKIKSGSVGDKELRDTFENYLDEIFDVLPKISDSKIAQIKAEGYDENSNKKDYKKIADDIKISTDKIVKDYEKAFAEYLEMEQEYSQAKDSSSFKKYKEKLFSKITNQIQNLYLDVFESSGMENKIGAVDVNVKLEIEAKFSKAVAQINSGKPVEDVAATFDELNALISGVLGKISDISPFMLFVASLTIILREGMEALIIVVAIISYIIQSGNKDRLNIAYSALLTGIVASFITAFAVSYLMGDRAGESRELIEGYTMLIAVALLFYVGFWLLSNAHNKKYVQALHSKAKNALESGSAKTLWITVFLAVFREGAETVLFYQALLFDAKTAIENISVFGGLGLGIVILIILYFLLKAGAIRIPVKQFFMVTSYIIFYMCFVFTGKGVMELIEGKVFIPHQFIIDFKSITWLGLHPYYESLIPQAIIFIAMLIGIVAMNCHYKKRCKV